MNRPRLEILVSRTNGEMAVLCPGPARVKLERRDGERVMPGSRLGFAVRDGRVFELFLGDGHGILSGIEQPGRWIDCGHGGLLARVVSMPEELPEPGHNLTHSGTSGFWEVRSPTHGTFYHRAAPGEDAYVTVGQHVHRGQTLGLVEVMKSFSPIAFEPPSGADSGVVRELVASDGQEVQVDAVLLRVEL